MIRHLLRLVWNRRRTNGLILVELTLCFLVLCATLTMACYYAINWNKPLGFDYENLWRLELSMGLGRDLTEAELAEARNTAKELLLQIGSMEEVEATTPLENFPYVSSFMMHVFDVNGVRLRVCGSTVTHEAQAALDLELLAGRWLEPGDEALNWEPVVVTRDVAEAVYGSQDPIGQPLHLNDQDGGASEPRPGEKERRIVGVVSETRIASELRPPYMTAFSLIDPEWKLQYRGGGPPRVYAIRTQPGIPAVFEEKLLGNINQIAPRWTAEITPVSRLRDRELRANLVPLSILGIIAGFLIIMVGLGLVGILWQAVTGRTEEIGIRRALGATRTQVRWQILGELLTMTTIAVVIGGILFVQMPILAVIGWLPWQAYIMALVLALCILYPFVIVCGMYPSWLATRVHPAEALQYE